MIFEHAKTLIQKGIWCRCNNNGRWYRQARGLDGEKIYIKNGDYIFAVPAHIMWREFSQNESKYADGWEVVQ